MNQIPDNGNPLAVLYGVRDDSIVPLVPQPVKTSIHLPLCFTYASQGDENGAYIVEGDAMFSMYGRDVNQANTPYTNINTPFIELFNSLANPMLMQRIVPEDAKRATLRPYVEVLATQVPKYKRDEDGNIIYGANNQPQVEGQQAGISLTWRTGAISKESGEFRNGKIFEGTQANAENVKSKIYPIVDLECPWRGRRGVDRGIRLSCLNARSPSPVSPTMVGAVGSRIMELQFVERPEPNMSPIVVSTNDGAPNVMFSFKKGAYYRAMRQDLDVDRLVVPNYRNMNPGAGIPPNLGMVQSFYTYRENLETVLEEVRLAHNVANPDNVIEDKYLMDIFTGLDVDGNPYNGIVVDTGALGGEIFSEDHTHYLIGGTDGTMSPEAFDLAVRAEMLSFGKGKVNYLDMNKYPCSFLWDVGYTTDTKMALCNFIGRRKDTCVVLSTHVYNEPVNTMQTETSMKLALSGFINSYPESSMYGTPACRGTLMGHSYFLNDSPFTDRMPLTYTLAALTSKYAGSQESKFKTAFRFSRGELTVITEGYDINLTYKDAAAYSSDWEKGQINVRSYDEKRYHIPALFTTYSNDRSVCKGYVYSIVVGDVERVANRVWTELTGASDLSELEIVKQINQRIIKYTQDKYDDTVLIVPNAYFTQQDRANGYSVTVDIEVHGRVIKTVHKYTIVAKRRVED